VLPATLRLTRRDDFALAIRRGRRVSAPGIVVHSHPGSGSGTPRVGFVVGRTVGNAVDRNLVRRRLRHVLAARVGDLPPGARVVIRATPTAGECSYATLRDSVDGALARLRSGSPAGASA